MISDDIYKIGRSEGGDDLAPQCKCQVGYENPTCHWTRVAAIKRGILMNDEVQGSEGEGLGSR
jgi:hypothetical protein